MCKKFKCFFSCDQEFTNNTNTNKTEYQKEGGWRIKRQVRYPNYYTHLFSSLSLFFRTIAKRAMLLTFVFGLVSLLSSLTRGAKVRRQLSALHIFSINSQPPLFQPPRMVIFHFTKVTRSENCGQLGRPALNWGRRLPAVSETPHKDTDRLFAKHPGFGFAQFFDPILSDAIFHFW